MKIVDLDKNMLSGTLFERVINEITDIGSNKSKDIKEPQEPDANGDVYEICVMCKGTGNNPFKKGGIHRSKGSVSPNTNDKMGGPCGTCHGSGKVLLYNANEVRNIIHATSTDELMNKSPDFYNMIINSKSPKLMAVLTDLDNGIQIPQKYVDLYMNKKKEMNGGKPEVLKPTKPDDKRVRQTPFVKKYINR